MKNLKDRGSLKQVKSALQMHSINHNIGKSKTSFNPTHARIYFGIYKRDFTQKLVYQRENF